MTTPSTADRLKESLIQWRGVTVITARLHKELLRRFVVYVANEDGRAVSLVAEFATEAAADLEHQKLVRQLSTGTKPKEAIK